MKEIRTLSQQQLDSMSLMNACKAIQARYTPEEWERMAHTTAATFTAEEIVEAAEPTMCEEGYENDLNCTCGFQWTETVEQQALRHAWDALQAVPAYTERKQS